MPVFISLVPLVGGITTVQLPDVRAQDGSLAETDATVAGVIVGINLDGTVQVQSFGLVTLTTAQWDAVTGGVGGLIQGHTYFPSTAGGGTITDVPPPNVGEFVTKIGTGLNPTTLLIELARPTQNLGDLIVFARFAGQPLIVGSAVFVATDNHIDAATSNVSLTDSQAIGVIAGFDVNSNPIVQLAGTVTLTTAEWDAVTDTSPGMVAGDAYYADTNANAGHLTVSKPALGAVTQIGVGLSTTQMVVNPPFPLVL